MKKNLGPRLGKRLPCRGYFGALEKPARSKWPTYDPGA